jgi:hypothetical protein
MQHVCMGKGPIPEQEQGSVELPSQPILGTRGLQTSLMIFYHVIGDRDLEAG